VDDRSRNETSNEHLPIIGMPMTSVLSSRSEASRVHAHTSALPPVITSRLFEVEQL
jgi:hypothetical protein